MALTFTGHPGPIRAVHLCVYAVSPGNAGVSGDKGGEMSQSRFIKDTIAGEPLVRAFGTFGLAAAIINITIGGGIFRLPSNVAASLGAAAPLAYLICAVAMALIVSC